jgi:predicted secreted protein
MSGTKYRGTALKVDWIGTIGTVALDAESRTFTVNQQANQIDVTVRSDSAKAFLTDFPAISVSMQGLDTSGTPTGGTAAQAWRKLNIGDSGTVVWYPEGKTAGYVKESMPAIVQNKNYENPYDGVSTWTLEFSSNGGSVTFGTAS